MKDDNREDDAGAGATSAAAGPIIVKKYANRRLYNTDTSSYVTLESLAGMVRAGQDFVVQDAKSGEDITRSVLTQIIFEEEARGRAPLLPTSFLRQLIRLYGDTIQSYVPPYLELVMAQFERNQEAFRSHLSRSFGGAPGYAQFEALTQANMEMLRRSMSVFAPIAATGAARPMGPMADGTTSDAGAPTAAEGADADRDPTDLETMRAQLSEMQRKLDELAKG